MALVSDYYDSVTADEWKLILGDELHFHFGYFQDGMSFDQALEHAVFRLLPYFRPRGKILDLGCDWGGPARYLGRRGYDVAGVTNSKAQQEYCSSVGLQTHILDMETSDLEVVGQFDGALMFESLEHVVDKRRSYRTNAHHQAACDCR